MITELSDELDQSDSGMESLIASKDDTPERRPEDSFITPSVCYRIQVKISCPFLIIDDII